MADLKEYGAGFGPDEDAQFWLGYGKTSESHDEIHICFSAKNRAEVRILYKAAIKADAKDNGKPGLRPEYHENYYGAFIFDFDGQNRKAPPFHKTNQKRHLDHSLQAPSLSKHEKPPTKIVSKPYFWIKVQRDRRSLTQDKKTYIPRIQGLSFLKYFSI